MKVKKRNGNIVDFDKNKIVVAILKAMREVEEVDKELALKIANIVEQEIADLATIDQIQDIVENNLMRFGSYKLSKAYITYRYLHDTARENYQKVINIIQEKGSAKNVQNQNANVDEASFGGRKGETIDEILKDYALNHCMCKKSRDHHLNNEIYQHDLNSYFLGLHNCFQRDTRFITDSGIKAFYQFSDKDKIKVLDKNGVWRDATVRYYGKQPMQKVTLTRCNKSVEISCTSNHRWILSDGTVTDDLRVGDRIIPLRDSTNFVIENKRSAEMFCFGFIIGDGCDHGDYIQARLCSDKLQYVDAFNKANYRFYTIKNSNDIVCVKNKEFGKQQFLTTSAWRLLSYKDKIALFNGYMAADGSRTTNTSLVWTSDDRILLMIKELSALAGYHIFKIRKIENSTNFKDNRMLYEIVFTKHYADNTTWVVADIEKKKNKEYEAWCVEEPITHSFTLEGGIVTGNCISLPLDDLLANGFVTRQVDIRPANSVNTAMQLVAVLFQIQSLVQFGFSKYFAEVK